MAEAAGLGAIMVYLRLSKRNFLRAANCAECSGLENAFILCMQLFELLLR